MTSAISLRHVTKRFGEVIAVDDLSLEIAHGQFVTLLGPSGCGKTSTLRLIGGFDRPDHGEISLDGEPMKDRPPYLRSVSLVFQNYALFPHLTIAQNMGFGLRERKMVASEIQSRVDAVLDLVELSGYGDRRPRELSGGQQQRVALARSLVLEPTVLLLDEPLGALDLRLRRQMQIELKQIQRQVGITFLYVTHDQEEAMSMSDRIVVMNRGAIEQDDTPLEIFERPANRFVAEFTGARNVLDGRVVSSAEHAATVTFGGLTTVVPVPIAGLHADQRVTVVIRPERVTLAPDAPAIGDLSVDWSTTIQDRAYKGATMSYSITLPDGTPLIVDHINARQTATFAEYDAVRVRIDPADLVVIA
jgi:spermidine/putrescine transport system ATP-binding protein